MNGIALLELIKNSNSFSELITHGNTQSKKGYLYEKIWDILIKMGLFTQLSSTQYHHYTGNVNTCRVKQVTDIENYISTMKVYSKGSGGCSDITLRNKFTDEWIFISSKYFINDSKKDIKSYDIQDILAVIHKKKHLYEKYKIVLIVNNVTDVNRIINSIQHTNGYIHIDAIYGVTDLELLYSKLRDTIMSIPIEQYNELFCSTKNTITVTLSSKPDSEKNRSINNEWI
jgi:hypothetical protein